MMRRLAFLVVFLLSLPLFAVVVLPTVLIAAVAGLVYGNDAADTVLLNPVLGWVCEAPFKVLERRPA